jgi:hypothetical protein
MDPLQRVGLQGVALRCNVSGMVCRKAQHKVQRTLRTSDFGNLRIDPNRRRWHPLRVSFSTMLRFDEIQQLALLPKQSLGQAAHVIRIYRPQLLIDDMATRCKQSATL